MKYESLWLIFRGFGGFRIGRAASYRVRYDTPAAHR